MKVLFRADSHAGMGGGHVMRCLTLANALAQAGAHCVFVCAAIQPNLARLITQSGHRLAQIDSPIPGESFAPGWECEPASDADQLADLAATQAVQGANEIDVVVVDHYLLDATWEDGWPDARLIAIDDLANRRHACNIIVDQNLGRSPVDYRDLVPQGCAILCGPDFALLRPEFSAARDRALTRRRSTTAIGHLLVNFGAADAGGLTLPVIRALAPAHPDLSVRVICGSNAASLADIQAFCEDHAGFELILDSQDMAGEMCRADLAIGAAGASSWERCTLGLPSIVMSVAENQNLLVDALSDASAILVADSAERVAQLVGKLKKDMDEWHALVACSAAIADGLGVCRVSEEIDGRAPDPGLVVRQASMEDAFLLWSWRNEPVARTMALTTKPVLLGEHFAWLDSTLANPDRTLLVGEAYGEPAGTIRLDRDADSAEISINVARPLRRRKLGAAFLERGREFAQAIGGLTHIRALVRPENQPSRRLFESCGYKRIGTQDDCIVYRLDLRQ